MVADRIGGVAGSLVRPIVQGVVNTAIGYVRSNYLPDWGNRALNMATDVSLILTDLEIQGLLRLGDEDRMTCELSGIHIWRQLVFNWTSGCSPGNQGCGRFELPMSELGNCVERITFRSENHRTSVHRYDGHFRTSTANEYWCRVDLVCRTFCSPRIFSGGHRALATFSIKSFHAMWLGTLRPIEFRSRL